MNEPVARMLPSDLARFTTSETTSMAFSVAVSTPDEHSVPLYAHEQSPIDMVLHCPACGAQHIDEPKVGEPDYDSMPDAPIVGLIAPEDLAERFEEMRQWELANWTNPPHRTHLCHSCGHKWRPADVATNGVAAVKTRGKDDSPIADRKGYDGGAT